MANTSAKKVVFRYENDTYPIVSSIKVSGNPVPLEKWEVFFYYNEVVDGVDKKIKIAGVADTRVEGKVKFFPREKYTTDTTNSVSVQAFTVPGEFEFSIVRVGVGYEADATGGFVRIANQYVVYDAGNGAHAGKQRYASYEESMTHAVGMIQVATRL